MTNSWYLLRGDTIRLGRRPARGCGSDWDAAAGEKINIKEPATVS